MASIYVNPQDYIGKQFNSFIVNKLVNSLKPYIYECVCSCGKKINLSRRTLQNSCPKSCGCQHTHFSRNNYVKVLNCKFNKLTIISIIDSKFCMCRCDCGNIKQCRISNVIHNNTKTCGCYTKSNLPKIGDKFGTMRVIQVYSSKKIKCKCDCGTTKILASCDLKVRKDGVCRCIPSTNPQERERGMKKWRKLVLDRDQETCQVCYKTNCPLDAHHLNCYNKFPDERKLLDNGITLCKSCHKDLHYRFGKFTTKEHYMQYKKLYLKSPSV